MFKPADYKTAAEKAAEDLAEGNDAGIANQVEAPPPAIIPVAIEDVAVAQGQQDADPTNEAPNPAEAAEIENPVEEEEVETIMNEQDVAVHFQEVRARHQQPEPAFAPKRQKIAKQPKKTTKAQQKVEKREGRREAIDTKYGAGSKRAKILKAVFID